MNNVWVWFVVYLVGAIASYIVVKLIDRHDEKLNGYHTKDATEEYVTGLVVLFSWLGIVVLIIIAILSLVKHLIDKYIFKEAEDE